MSIFWKQMATRVFEHACRMGLEGIVAKRVDAPYRSGRQDSWIKLKCIKSDTFPDHRLRGEARSDAAQDRFTLCRSREGDRLLYAGKARSGYTESLSPENCASGLIH